MSVKKAIQDLDLLIKNKKYIKSGVLDLLCKWDKDNEDIVSRDARLLVRSLQSDLDWLHGIKKQLLPEQHRTKIVCTHPIEDHDICDNQKYCMNCNQDL